MYTTVLMNIIKMIKPMSINRTALTYKTIAPIRLMSTNVSTTISNKKKLVRYLLLPSIVLSGYVCYEKYDSKYDEKKKKDSTKNFVKLDEYCTIRNYIENNNMKNINNTQIKYDNTKDIFYNMDKFMEFRFLNMSDRFKKIFLENYNDIIPINNISTFNGKLNEFASFMTNKYGICYDDYIKEERKIIIDFFWDGISLEQSLDFVNKIDRKQNNEIYKIIFNIISEEKESIYTLKPKIYNNNISNSMLEKKILNVLIIILYAGLNIILNLNLKLNII